MSAAGRMRRATEAAASAAVAALSRDAAEQHDTGTWRAGGRFVRQSQAEPAGDGLRPPEETLRRFQRQSGDIPAVP